MYIKLGTRQGCLFLLPLFHIALERGFSMLGLLIVFVVGGCSVPCRMFNSSPGLCVSDDNGTPPHQWEQSRMSWDTAKCPLGGEIPLLENHCFRAFRHCSKRKRINRCYIWKGRNKLILICKLYFCPSRLKSKWINRRT